MDLLVGLESRMNREERMIVLESLKESLTLLEKEEGEPFLSLFLLKQN